MLNSFKKYLAVDIRQREGTVIQTNRHVVEFISWCDEQGLQPVTARYADLIAFMRHQEEQGRSTLRINRSFGSLRHYYNYLMEKGKVKNNPAQNIIKAGQRRRAVHSVFTRAELDKLYFELPENTDREIQFKCAAGLLIFQGAITAELGRMLPEHIDLFKGTVYLIGGSRSNSRELRLESQQILLLNKYLEVTRPSMTVRRKKFSRMVFFTFDGGVSLSNVWTYLKEELQKHLPKLTNLKEIRTNVIVHWLKTENLIRVKYMAGHRYVSSTEYYQLEDVETLKEELETFFPKF